MAHPHPVYPSLPLSSRLALMLLEPESPLGCPWRLRGRWSRCVAMAVSLFPNFHSPWKDRSLPWLLHEALGWLAISCQDPWLTVSPWFCSRYFSVPPTYPKRVWVILPSNVFLHYRTLHWPLPVATTLTASHLALNYTLCYPVPHGHKCVNPDFIDMDKIFSIAHRT